MKFMARLALASAIALASPLAHGQRIPGAPGGSYPSGVSSWASVADGEIVVRSGTTLDGIVQSTFIKAAGLAGGQTLNGGTTNSDKLVLKNYTSSVRSLEQRGTGTYVAQSAANGQAVLLLENNGTYQGLFASHGASYSSTTGFFANGVTIAAPYAGGLSLLATDAAGNIRSYTGASTTLRQTIDPDGNIVPGAAGLGTTDNGPFQYMFGMPGTPTGTPTSFSNRHPFVWDSTNHQMYVNESGWRTVGAPYNGTDVGLGTGGKYRFGGLTGPDYLGFSSSGIDVVLNNATRMRATGSYVLIGDVPFYLANSGNGDLRGGWNSGGSMDITSTGHATKGAITITAGGSGILVSATRLQAAQSTDVASGATITMVQGNLAHVTGTTNVDCMTTTNWQAGAEVTLIFDNILTVSDANGGCSAGTANFQLATAYVTTANDTLKVAYDGTSWFEVSRSSN